MLKCKDVVAKADALVDGTSLTMRERIALRMHLLMCHHCRRYVHQLRVLVNTLPRETDRLEDAQTRDIKEKLDTSRDP